MVNFQGLCKASREYHLDRLDFSLPITVSSFKGQSGYMSFYIRACSLGGCGMEWTPLLSWSVRG